VTEKQDEKQTYSTTSQRGTTNHAPAVSEPAQVEVHHQEQDEQVISVSKFQWQRLFFSIIILGGQL